MRSGSPRLYGVYLGGLLGPFGAGVVVAMLPELAASYGTSPAGAASSLTVYLVPFAAIMLVSGTLGERWGVVRTLRFAYAAYAATALLALVAPWFWLFLTARGLQGAANAFITPLLLAQLAAVTPRDRLGRALGLFAAMQALGHTTAPLVGGLAAELSWPWAFAGIAVTALALAAAPLPADPAAGERVDWRSVVRPSVVPGVLVLVGWGCLSGLSFLVAFRLEDVFELSSGPRGLALTVFGAAGFLTARLSGAYADRFGPVAALATGLLGGGAVVAVLGLAGSLPVLVAAWAAGGVVAQLISVGTNTLVITRAGAARNGAISVVQALRFLGMACSPLAFTGLYHADPRLAFLVPAAVLVAATPILVRAR
ncbi:MFS transporter [Amycolatopsis sp. YIM 10]|uniref:MFS transporter n=1 Tax=Amycolatopsis sp. YIM 10 TaxID=2653857 RepID=UPI0012A79E04|nr:MFS transporter [Amycolatopsis sp. YIM 10]QFU90654.1 Multidrug efflux protein YfmO [Amycolatopsis sp. YIM 10]